MSIRVGFFREIYQLIAEELCARGMRKHSKGRYSRDITNDAVGALGLNAATKHGFSINPLIGVQYIPLECLLAQLEERPFRSSKSGTSIVCPIGYLCAGQSFRMWEFKEGQDNESVVNDMVHQITTVGFRYMDENCTLEKVCERLAVNRHFVMGNDVHHLPVGYMMLGRFDEAEQIVRNRLAQITAHRSPTIEEIEERMGEKVVPEALGLLEKTDGQSIPAHENYRRFAERFFRRLTEERQKNTAVRKTDT